MKRVLDWIPAEPKYDLSVGEELHCGQAIIDQTTCLKSGKEIRVQYLGDI